MRQTDFDIENIILKKIIDLFCCYFFNFYKRYYYYK